MHHVQAGTRANIVTERRSARTQTAQQQKKEKGLCGDMIRPQQALTIADGAPRTVFFLSPVVSHTRTVWSNDADTTKSSCTEAGKEKKEKKKSFTQPDGGGRK